MIEYTTKLYLGLSQNGGYPNHVAIGMEVQW